MTPKELYDDPNITVITAPSFEKQVFERKRQRPADILANTISGVANSNHLGGLLVIGIEPKFDS